MGIKKIRGEGRRGSQMGEWGLQSHWRGALTGEGQNFSKGEFVRISANVQRGFSPLVKHWYILLHSAS